MKRHCFPGTAAMVIARRDPVETARKRQAASGSASSWTGPTSLGMNQGSRRRVPMPSRPSEPSAAPIPTGDTLELLTRIAAALERIAPRPPAAPDLTVADAFVWHAAGRRLSPVPKVNRLAMGLLRGIDRLRDTLADNTERFARGLPANNALL